MAASLQSPLPSLFKIKRGTSVASTKIARIKEKDTVRGFWTVLPELLRKESGEKSS